MKRVKLEIKPESSSSRSSSRAGDIAGDFLDEGAAEIGQLYGAYAGDAAELFQRRRETGGDFAQGDVGEDDVGGDVALVGDCAAQLFQPVEKDFVAGVFAGGFAAARFAGFLGSFAGDVTGEGDRATGAEGFEALGGEVHGHEFAGLLGEKAEADQFAAIGLPLGAFAVAAYPVGGDLLVAPFADGLGIGAHEDLDNVIEAEGEAALLADAVNAGKEFLGVECAVEGLARGEAIVAGLAVLSLEGLAEVIEKPAAAAAGVF